MIWPFVCVCVCAHVLAANSKAERPPSLSLYPSGEGMVRGGLGGARMMPGKDIWQVSELGQSTLSSAYQVGQTAAASFLHKHNCQRWRGGRGLSHQLKRLSPTSGDCRLGSGCGGWPALPLSIRKAPHSEDHPLCLLVSFRCFCCCFFSCADASKPGVLFDGCPSNFVIIYLWSRSFCLVYSCFSFVRAYAFGCFCRLSRCHAKYMSSSASRAQFSFFHAINDLQC